MAKQVFNVTIESDYNIDEAIEIAVKNSVTESIRKQVDETVKKEINEQVQARVAEQVEDTVSKALRTKVQLFNYDGSVKEERSFEDAMKEGLKEIGKEGLNFKIKGSDGYRGDTMSISDLIQRDVYTMVSKKLAPQFKAIEEDFSQKSKEALRSFAIQAIDESNRKTLRG